jgi:uncharacterized protein (DUF2235 family)
VNKRVILLFDGT